MAKTHSLTQGNILGTLIRFAVPVFFTLFLQALYGGVDLLVVGQFASTADVSGVATGSMLLSTVTMIITGLSMGITILVGERIGSQRPKEAGRAIGSGICLFIVFGILLTLIMIGGAGFLANALHAPAKPLTRPAIISPSAAAVLFLLLLIMYWELYFEGSEIPKRLFSPL